MPLTNVMQLLLERKPAGILPVSTVDHVAQCRHPLLGLALEPDRARAFAIDRGDLFARAQIGDGPSAFGCGHTVSDAATGPTPVKTKHQARPLRCSAVDKGINAEGSMSADEPRLDTFDEPKLRPPHQRAIGKHPQVLRRVKSIRVHGM